MELLEFGHILYVWQVNILDTFIIMDPLHFIFQKHVSNVAIVKWACVEGQDWILFAYEAPTRRWVPRIRVQHAGEMAKYNIFIKFFCGDTSGTREGHGGICFIILKSYFRGHHVILEKYWE